MLSNLYTEYFGIIFIARLFVSFYSSDRFYLDGFSIYHEFVRYLTANFRGDSSPNRKHILLVSQSLAIKLRRGFSCFCTALHLFEIYNIQFDLAIFVAVVAAIVINYYYYYFFLVAVLCVCVCVAD